MCYNCGCHNPQDTMGSEDNITESKLEELSKKWGKSLDETKREVLSLIKSGGISTNPNTSEMFTKAAKAWGQSTEDAQENVQDLLEQELE